MVAAMLLGSLGLLTLILVACGGGSSSNTGPSSVGGGGGSGSGAIIQGQLVNRRTASGESAVVVVLRTALGIGLAEAAAVPNVTVVLVRQEDGSTASTVTDGEGNFTFSNVLPGSYTITVEGKTVDPLDPLLFPIVVGEGDVANITGTVTDSTVIVGNVAVVASKTSTEIILQNDAQVAHLLNIAKAAGLVSADPILQLRLDGWGWGRICKQFNVHPRVIGLGHGGVSDNDIEAFRTAHGHGNGKGNGKGKKKG
jgi:hypothetical protein